MGVPGPLLRCGLNICRAQTPAMTRISGIGLRASFLTQVGPASQIPCPLLVTAVCTALRRALCPAFFVYLGEAPDISLLFYSPLTLRSTATPWGPCLRLSSDPSLPVTKGCLREPSLGWQTSLCRDASCSFMSSWDGQSVALLTGAGQVCSWLGGSNSWVPVACMSCTG